MKLGRHSVSAEKLFWLLLASWFVVNFLQAAFTGISNDEAYYALWGQHLAWGYFDHPPMVAIFNFISSLLFGGTLGVRFTTVLAQVGTLWLTWRILDDKQADAGSVYTFFILAASLVMFAALGFVTTPDAPLLLFTALFLLGYKRFLSKESTWNSVLLCLGMAGMVYSKYQSALVILLVVLSNLKLLLRPKFWLAGIAALLLLIPHFLWQFNNDFPSFKYHLVDRSNRFQFRYFLEYIPNQLVVFNPFTLGLVVFVLVKYTIKDVFERALTFIVVGFIGFFWVMSYRGHVEPHWTVAASLPILLLLYARASEYESVRAFIHRYILGSLFLILLIRIALVVPPLAGKAGFNEKAKYKAIEKIAGNLPVVFAGSFQQPSLYSFFSGKTSTTISSVYNRRTQFDCWQLERSLEGKPAFVCVKVDGLSKTYHVDGQDVDGFFTQSFHSAMRLPIKTEAVPAKTYRRGAIICVKFSIENTYDYAINFQDSIFPTQVCGCFFNKKTKSFQPVVSDQPFTILPSKGKLHGSMYVTVPTDVMTGNYRFVFTTNSRFGPAIENEMVPITIAP